MEIRKNLDEAGKNTSRFLNDAMPDHTDQLTLWQYIGYSMTRDTRFQRFMIIRGIGGTGKSKVRTSWDRQTVAVSAFRH